jgi:membrane protein implicated in regulation of membrane protease activity
VSDLPTPPHAYRGSAILHGILAVVILAVAAISGGSLARALLVAVAYFLVATGWSWFRFRRREARTDHRRQATSNGGKRS